MTEIKKSLAQNNESCENTDEADGSAFEMLGCTIASTQERKKLKTAVDAKTSVEKFSYENFLKLDKNSGERAALITGKENFSVGENITFGFGNNTKLWEKATAGNTLPAGITTVKTAENDTNNEPGTYIRRGISGEFFLQGSNNRLTIHTGTSIQILKKTDTKTAQQTLFTQHKTSHPQYFPNQGEKNLPPEKNSPPNIAWEAIKRGIDPQFAMLFQEKKSDQWQEILTQVQRLEAVFDEKIFNTGFSGKYSAEFSAFVFQHVFKNDKNKVTTTLKTYGYENFSPPETKNLYEDADTKWTKAQLKNFAKNSADQYGVDLSLVKAIITNESNWKIKAKSPVGAQGLMQIMPDTAEWIGKKWNISGDVWHPKVNIQMGTRYLVYLLDKYDGNTRLAIAAYNAGPGNVRKHNGVPPFKETQKYVKQVMRDMKTIS